MIPAPSLITDVQASQQIVEEGEASWSWSSSGGILLGASSGLFGKMAAKCKAGAKRAATYAKDGVAPSYFQFKVTDYETLLNAHNGRGLPPVKVLAFEESPLPQPRMHAPNVSSGTLRLPNAGPVVQYDE